MEIKRKIYAKIVEWKETSKGTKSLLIEGARRIGKSTVAEEIGKKEYKSYILVDFNNATSKILAAFDNLSNLDIFFQTLSLEYNKRLYNRESLIIFDEIQKFPKARQAIKYLVADGRYDYIETGALISIRENVENITLPSEERKIKMYPLDFEEFMTYMDEELLYDYIVIALKRSIRWNKQCICLKNICWWEECHKQFLLLKRMPEILQWQMLKKETSLICTGMTSKKLLKNIILEYPQYLKIFQPIYRLMRKRLC